MAAEFIDRRRDEIIEILTESFSRDILDTDEYERRVERANQVNELAQLNSLVEDLRPGTGRQNGGSMVPYPGPGNQELRGILSSQRFEGDWLSRENVNVRVIMGSVICDLRQPVLGPLTHINLNIIMGEVKILVPRGVSLRINVNPILGEVERHHSRNKLGRQIKGMISSFLGVENNLPLANPGNHPAPVVEISGTVVMGSVSVVEYDDNYPD